LWLIVNNQNHIHDAMMLWLHRTHVFSVLSRFVSFCLILSRFVSFCLVLSHFVSFRLVSLLVFIFA
jgi:hypothetical protein